MRLLERIDSLGELLERLRREKASVVVGAKDESHCEYFLMRFPECTVGICSQGQGIDPSLVPSDVTGDLWIGYNFSIAIVDLHSCVVKRVVDLGSLFHEILRIMDDGSAIVICELGALRIGGTGGIIWKVITDLVVGFSEQGDLLLLQTDGGTVRVDKGSGILDSRRL
jgi:hypothetical protein